MTISKFGLACVAAIFAGGATASVGVEGTPAPAVQVATTEITTPISAIARPNESFRNIAVQFTSGKTFGHVIGVVTNGAGRATGVRVRLSDLPSQAIWLDQDDLGYSRSHDVIVAHDVHAPNLAVADAR
jgi:hypothetical protein